MRILVTGQPASGLFRLAGMLKEIYNLHDLNATDGALPTGSEELVQYLNDGGFPDQAILAHHYLASDDLVKTCAQHDCHIICVIRNPYLAYEALHLHANTANALVLSPESRSLAGTSLGSSESMAFIKDHYSGHLAISTGWMNTEAAQLVQLERLSFNPAEVLARICSIIGEVEENLLDKYANEQSSKNRIPLDLLNMTTTRLPKKVVCELNKVIPQQLLDKFSYRKEACSPGEEFPGFADFLTNHGSKQRIFLVGHGKSGTTWLHMLFFHHPSTAVVAERRLIEHPDQNTALLDTLLKNDEFDSWFNHSSFGTVTPEIYDIRYELSRVLSEYLLYRTLSMRNTVKGFARKEEITHFSEKIALNTEEDALLTIKSLKEIYPSAKIIHIVRDPRDVAVSALHHSYRNFKESHEENWITKFVGHIVEGKAIGLIQAPMAASYFKKSAQAWTGIVSAFHDNGKRLFQDNYLLTRYEDLLSQPDDMVSELFSFCNLNASEEVVSSVVDAASFKKLSKGRKAGEEDSSSFYRKGISGDWKNYLTENQSRKYFSHARRLMEEFGYH